MKGKISQRQILSKGSRSTYYKASMKIKSKSKNNIHKYNNKLRDTHKHI